MKKTAFVIFALLLLTAPVPAAGDAFSEANAAYSRSDYKAAAEAYEKITTGGGATAAIYYNLGNARFRAGEKGKAMVAFERAHRLDPRDRDVEWNKAILKNALADRIEDPDENVFLSSLQKILEAVTVDEAAAAFGGVLVILFLLSAANFAFHHSRALTTGVSGLFVFLLVVAAGVFYFKWADAAVPHVVVLDREVAARYGPSDKETKAFVLHEGAEARVADETGDWFYISLKNKTLGWVPKKSCEIV